MAPRNDENKENVDPYSSSDLSPNTKRILDDRISDRGGQIRQPNFGAVSQPRPVPAIQPGATPFIQPSFGSDLSPNTKRILRGIRDDMPDGNVTLRLPVVVSAVAQSSAIPDAQPSAIPVAQSSAVSVAQPNFGSNFSPNTVRILHDLRYSISDRGDAVYQPNFSAVSQSHAGSVAQASPSFASQPSASSASQPISCRSSQPSFSFVPKSSLSTATKYNVGLRTMPNLEPAKFQKDEFGNLYGKDEQVAKIDSEIDPFVIISPELKSEFNPFNESGQKGSISGQQTPQADLAAKVTKVESGPNPRSDMRYFSRLPGEIRNGIYRLVLVNDGSTYIKTVWGTCCKGRCIHTKAGNCVPSIASVCRQMRWETMPIWLVENKGLIFDAGMMRNACIGNFLASIGHYADLVDNYTFEIKRSVNSTDEWLEDAIHRFKITYYGSGDFDVEQSELEDRTVCACWLFAPPPHYSGYRPVSANSTQFRYHAQKGLMRYLRGNWEDESKQTLRLPELVASALSKGFVHHYVWQMHRTKQAFNTMPTCARCSLPLGFLPFAG